MVGSNWQTYEEVATYLMGKFSIHFGLSRVEGKQTIIGERSGTQWTIDAKGILDGESEAIVIIDCRRHTTSKEDQEQLGGLAYRIIDTRATGGILVSPIGFQSGAEKVAKAENIVHVELHQDSTELDFMMRFMSQLFIVKLYKRGNVPAVDSTM